MIRHAHKDTGDVGPTPYRGRFPNVKGYFIYRVVRNQGLDLLSLSESLKALRIRPFLSRFLARDGYPLERAFIVEGNQ